VRRGGVLGRHRHPSPVHGFVLKGRWRYLEHSWVADEGSYVFETPGEVHTLTVDDDDEMQTFFYVGGPTLYVDENDQVTVVEDNFQLIELAREHYAKVGLGADFVNQFIR
jgi:2,4'-dihydroxyacetophenone dioxygenase